MQDPPTTSTEDDEASIPTEHDRNGPSMNPTITVRRKAAKRSLPWKLAADEIQLALSPPPQDEDTRATKRPRLEEPVPTSTDGAATNTTSATIAVALPPSETTADHTESDPMTETQPNARTTGATGHWTLLEDAKLISAVTNTRKKRNRKNWAAIAALVPGRTTIQCQNRWHNALDPSIDQMMAGSKGKWKEDEDIKLKDAVQKHGNDWVAIAALVPGRTRRQCWSRWHDVLNHIIDRTTARTGKWKEDEDIKLKNAVQKHGNGWVAIAALVPGRTNIQCKSRWHNALDPSIYQMTGSTGKWEEEEDIKLKAAVQTHGGKNWVAIATLVPSRTRLQCWNRWRNVLNPSIGRVTGRKRKWEEDEDIKLKGAVQKHGNDWVAIAALVSGRTRSQCKTRWYNALNPSIAQTTGSTGKWEEEEDIKLKAAVQTHGGENWVAIAALVPGRTKRQCWARWKKYVDPNRSTVRK
jgi:hypothetical protein